MAGTPPARGAVFACLCAFVCPGVHRATRAPGATRAGKLVWSDPGSTSCPAGSYVITDVTQCQSAAATAGKGWGGSYSYSNAPRGCYGAAASSNVVLNTHPTGGANPDLQLLCAIGTGPALARAHTQGREHSRESARERSRADARADATNPVADAATDDHADDAQHGRYRAVHRLPRPGTHTYTRACARTLTHSHALARTHTHFLTYIL